MWLIYQSDNAKAVVAIDRPGIEQLVSLLESQDEKRPKSKAALEKNARKCIRPESPDEARDMMRYFADSFGETGKVSPYVMEWAAACFHYIAESDPTDKQAALRALCVTRAAHRPQKNRSRNWSIRERVDALRQGGHTLEAACAAVAEEFGIEESNAKKIYLRESAKYIPF